MGFHRDERATSDVEYILLTGLVVPLIFFTVPPLLMLGNSEFFRLIHIFVNLPFP